MTEWFKVTVLKTVVGQLTASSNLALSAKLVLLEPSVEIPGVRSRSGSSRGGVFTGRYKWLVGSLRYQSYQSVVVSLLISSWADAISSVIRARA